MGRFVTETSASAEIARQRRAAEREKLEAVFALQARAAKLAHGMVRNHRFHPVRQWKLDFAWPDYLLAVEVEGGTWSGGRHVRGAGFEEDAQKYLEAMMLGWRVIRATGSMVKSGQVINAVDALIGGGCGIHQN